MNRLLLYLFTFVLLAGSAGCTQNNGYIGPIFGSWSLMGVSEDGVDLELEDETVFSFQNEIVQVMRIFNSFDRESRFGNFKISDDVLSMKFLTELSPEGEGRDFLMPTWLYFPTGEMPLRFEVLTLTRSRMVLETVNDGKTYRYVFSRTW